MARPSIAAGALAVLMTAACGQRGPLYLPEEAPTEVRQPSPASQPPQEKTQEEATQAPQTTTTQGTTQPPQTPKQQATTQSGSEPSRGTPADAGDAQAEERRKSGQPDEKPR